MIVKAADLAGRDGSVMAQRSEDSVAMLAVS